MRKIYLFLLLLLSVSALLVVHKRSKPASPDYAASVYYVSVTGNDTNPGTASSPFKTILKGISVAQSGDTVRIKSGTYKENITINGKNGQPGAPIRIIGDTGDTNQYPIIDGGDPGFIGSANPAFKIINSSWWNFERLKIINSTDDAYYLENSHYITVRRNIINFHRHGLRLKNKSSHILVEYNEMFQSFPASSSWSQLKGSKWEGGAFTSFGGAGMNIIRFNYIHNIVNGIVLYSGGRIGNYYDANIWIYRNRFEQVIDDPYEPESYAFNNHFFNNTLINTHRMTSLAPGGSDIIQGPVYIYNNMQLVTKDITLEAGIGRANSAFKVDLSGNYFRNGAFAFNNSVDVSSPGINGYGVDTLTSTIRNFKHTNNTYRSEKQTILKSTLTLINSEFDYDMSQTALGYAEPHGFPNMDPQFMSLSNENLRLQSTSPARDKSQPVSYSLGFSTPEIIPGGSDLGAFQFSATDFRTTPLPKYEIPPGGEDSSFPANSAWTIDTEGGANPPSGPKWLPTGYWTTSTGEIITPLPTDSGRKPGDANNDNKVDGVDYVFWLQNYYKTVTSGFSAGDFDINGFVDGLDYVIWLQNYNK